MSDKVLSKPLVSVSSGIRPLYPLWQTEKHTSGYLSIYDQCCYFIPPETPQNQRFSYVFKAYKIINVSRYWLSYGKVSI